uniref:TIL domain-containing protein n=1 Tax=Anopheles culicifacies TaxID=139723 RepID=A0A182MJ37_9DIPT
MNYNISIPIWRETVLSVPIESLITSSCSSCPTKILCCVANVSSTKRLELESSTAPPDDDVLIALRGRFDVVEQRLACGYVLITVPANAHPILHRFHLIPGGVDEMSSAGKFAALVLCNYDCNGPNEEYYSCTSPCRRNCASLTKPLENCETMCVSGCFCKLGYFRREDNACVKPWLCANDTLESKFPNRINLESLH